MKESIFKIKYKLYKPQTFNYYKYLLLSQHKSKYDIEKESFEKFKKIFSHAYYYSSYYHKKYLEADIKPDMIKSLNDLDLIPSLTKEEIRTHFNSLTTQKINLKYIGVSTTGGSSGTPLKTLFDKRVPVEAFGWRYLNCWKLNPWDDGAYIWRMVRKNEILNTLNQILWWPTKKIRLDASYLDDIKLAAFRNKINKYRPKLIQGYVGAITEFAEYLNRNKLTIHSPASIWVTSAPISKVQRNIIEEVFKAPVYDEYGSSEIPWLAAQCSKKQLLHINAEGRLIEVVDEKNKKVGYDHEGKLFITDLLNYYFPLIRYENGDKGTLSSAECACGSNLPLLYPVKGRVSDTIRSPQGRALDGSFLTTVFDNHIEYIKNFQFYQSIDYKIILKIVPNKEMPDWKKYINDVVQNLKIKVFFDFVLDLEIKDEIISDRGKTRFIISERK